MKKYFRIPVLLKGLSLVELLVSLFILTTVSSIVLGIIWITLRSTVKVNNMNQIRQNGNFVITQLTKMLQFAQQFNGVSTDGSTYTTVCQSPATTPLQSYSHVSITNTANNTVILSCRTVPYSTIASDSASLINTTSYTLSACRFTCTQAALDAPFTIGIEYTIQKRIGGSIFDDPAPVYFQTSATIRNIIQ